MYVAAAVHARIPISHVLFSDEHRLRSCSSTSGPIIALTSLWTHRVLHDGPGSGWVGNAHNIDNFRWFISAWHCAALVVDNPRSPLHCPGAPGAHSGGRIPLHVLQEPRRPIARGARLAHSSPIPSNKVRGVCVPRGSNATAIAATAIGCWRLG